MIVDTEKLVDVRTVAAAIKTGYTNTVIRIGRFPDRVPPFVNVAGRNVFLADDLIAFVEKSGGDVEHAKSVIRERYPDLEM